jgi:hypothetical protein
MSVDIGALVGEGIDRTTDRNGLLIAAIFYVLAVPSALISAGANRQAGMGPAQPGMGTAPDPGLGLGLIVVVGLVLTLASLVVTVGAIRTFVSEETETLDAGDFTDDLAVVVVNLVVGGLLFAIAVGIGFVLFVVPGLFLLTALFFWNYHVIVDGENFVEAFARSWELTSGHRLSLFGLGVVVVVINAAISYLFGLPNLVLPGVLGFLVSQVGSALGNVFVLATASRTFVALSGDRHEPTEDAPREHAYE